MLKILNTIIKEPLVHFLFLGALLYVYYDLNSDELVQIKEPISLSAQEVENIKSNYLQNNGVMMDDTLLDIYKKEAYYKKIVLNEAYSMGLEKQDKQIQEKLLQKMQFIMTNQSQILEPSEEELLLYYKKNISDYSELKSISFAHIYFSNPKDKNIQTTLELLKTADVDSEKASYFGDKFEPSNFVKNIDLEQLRENYGDYFTSKISALKQGLWHDAVYSKYGVHLIYIRSKDIGKAYPFDELQERVYLDYKDEELRKREKKAYQEFRSQYRIEGE